jgi:hypothetical protein
MVTDYEGIVPNSNEGIERRLAKSEKVKETYKNYEN